MKFQLLAFCRCLSRGHKFMNSHSAPGKLTCTRCGWRRQA